LRVKKTGLNPTLVLSWLVQQGPKELLHVFKQKKQALSYSKRASQQFGKRENPQEIRKSIVFTT
jgi:hypothetical protein